MKWFAGASASNASITDAPRFTKSMQSAMDTLKLDELKVIHTGKKSYELDENVQALPLSHPHASPSISP